MYIQLKTCVCFTTIDPHYHMSSYERSVTKPKQRYMYTNPDFQQYSATPWG